MGFKQFTKAALNKIHQTLATVFDYRDVSGHGNVTLTPTAKGDGLAAVVNLLAPLGRYKITKGRKAGEEVLVIAHDVQVIRHPELGDIEVRLHAQTSGIDAVALATSPARSRKGANPTVEPPSTTASQPVVTTEAPQVMSAAAKPKRRPGRPRKSTTVETAEAQPNPTEVLGHSIAAAFAAFTVANDDYMSQ